MTLTDQDREQLIKNHIDKSIQAVEDVDFLIKSKKLHLAANRIYYGIYYILSALALRRKFSTRNHGQLIGWFNKNFIKTGIVDKRYSSIVRHSFELRSEADYDVLTVFTREEIASAHADMRALISTIRELLKNGQ